MALVCLDVNVAHYHYLDRFDIVDQVTFQNPPPIRLHSYEGSIGSAVDKPECIPFFGLLFGWFHT